MLIKTIDRLVSMVYKYFKTDIRASVKSLCHVSGFPNNLENSN